MSQSSFYRSLKAEVRRLEKTYLNFKPRLGGNYTRRQMSAAAAFTVFCHAEFETFLEAWATHLIDLAKASWASKRVTRPLVHLCTFEQGRNELDVVPSKDIWSELIMKAIRKHEDIIKKNNGIKENSICKLFVPLGFDVRQIDPILLGDISTFGVIRESHAHQSHKLQFGQNFDPFDRKNKAIGLVYLLESLDQDLQKYLKSCR